VGPGEIRLEELIRVEVELQVEEHWPIERDGAEFENSQRLSLDELIHIAHQQNILIRRIAHPPENRIALQTKCTDIRKTTKEEHI
jgi:hypothetical protein